MTVPIRGGGEVKGRATKDIRTFFNMFFFLEFVAVKKLNIFCLRRHIIISILRELFFRPPNSKSLTRFLEIFA